MNKAMGGPDGCDLLSDPQWNARARGASRLASEAGSPKTTSKREQPAMPPQLSSLALPLSCARTCACFTLAGIFARGSDCSSAISDRRLLTAAGRDTAACSHSVGAESTSSRDWLCTYL